MYCSLESRLRQKEDLNLMMPTSFLQLAGYVGFVDQRSLWRSQGIDSFVSATHGGNGSLVDKQLFTHNGGLSRVR